MYLQIDQQQSTDNRISQMFDLTFRNTSGDDEKRKQVHKIRFWTFYTYYMPVESGFYVTLQLTVRMRNLLGNCSVMLNVL